LRHAGLSDVLAHEFLVQEILGFMSDQQQQTPRRTGRPPKPGRTQVHCWVPEPLAELLKQDAAANALPASDRLAEILAAFYSGDVILAAITSGQEREAMPQAS
jgi:hypothetical protein